MTSIANTIKKINYLFTSKKYCILALCLDTLS